MTHIPIHPFWAWHPLMQPRGLDMATWWYHKRSERSQDHNGRYFSSWIDLTVTGSASKVQLFQRRKGAFCTGLPPGLPKKENLGGSILQSAASDRHHHTLRGHNLNYTIWILYAESVSFLVNKCHFPSGRAPLKWARPFLSIRQTWARPSQVSAPLSSERAPLKWARPSQVSAPLSINQANLSAPFKRGALLPILQQWVKNLDWMKGWPKRNQLVETERGVTHFSSACLLPVYLETPILKRVYSHHKFKSEAPIFPFNIKS